MRKIIYQGTREEGLALFRAADVFHLATTTPEGRPVLRVLHGVVLDDAWIVFHGSASGEKSLCVGREAVLSVHGTLAEVPSYAVHAEYACPATTYYQSAQLHGTLEEIVDPDEKARALQALMERFQPEGGYAPIRADHPHYRRALETLLLVRVSMANLDAKVKLGQNRRGTHLVNIMALLWRRGRPSDPAAIEAVRRANPDNRTPDFLHAPPGLRLLVDLDEARVEEAVALLADTYWSESFTRDAIREAMLRSDARVGVVDLATDRLVACARALSDGTRHAWIYDVVVADHLRGTGVGTAMMRLLLDHPAVRHARVVRLATRDAQDFYRRLDFIDLEEALRARPWRSTEMVWRRGRERWLAPPTPTPTASFEAEA